MTRMVVVGASDKTLWSHWLVENFSVYRTPGELWLVNPNRTELFGLPCYPSLDDLPGAPEVGVLIVRPDQSVEACRQLLDLGARTIAVVANGFKETGTPEGTAAEQALVDMCHAAGALLLGPNAIGFASLHEAVCAIAEPVPAGMVAGDVSLISQSGAMVSGLLDALNADGLGIDMCYSIGNGASFDVADAIGSIAGRATTTVCCAVVEGLPDRDRLGDALRKGRAAGQTHLMLLLGQSEGSKRVAMSHTGAIIGEQRIAKQWLRGEGVIVVESVAELARTAMLSRSIPVDPAHGVFIITGSGGAAGFAGDVAERHRVPLAELTDPTAQRLAALLPHGASAGNPLDMMGGGGRDNRREILRTVGADPNVDVVIEPYALTWADDTPGRSWHRTMLGDLAEQVTATGTPVIVTNTSAAPPTPWMRSFAEHPDVLVCAGIEATMAALGRLYGAAEGGARRARRTTGAAQGAATVIAEAAARAVFEAAGLPVVRGVTIAPGADVANAADGLAAPWVLKLDVAGVGHKGRVGGVKVGLSSPQALHDAAADISSAAVAAGVVTDAGEVGFLLQEMVSGPEVLVGAVRDPVVGPSITVGVGGWAAEAVPPIGTLLVPISDGEIRSAVEAWDLERLLGADRCADLVAFVVSLARAFGDDGPLAGYQVAECNPVMLSPRGPVCADVLLVEGGGNTAP